MRENGYGLQTTFREDFSIVQIKTEIKKQGTKMYLKRAYQ